MKKKTDSFRLVSVFRLSLQDFGLLFSLWIHDFHGQSYSLNTSFCTKEYIFCPIKCVSAGILVFNVGLISVFQWALIVIVPSKISSDFKSNKIHFKI